MVTSKVPTEPTTFGDGQLEIIQRLVSRPALFLRKSKLLSVSVGCIRTLKVQLKIPG
jgi:hypothetical protein